MITVTNATNQQQADIFPNKIFGLSYSDNMKCTIIITSEGGQFPVLESKDHILKLIKEQKITVVGGKK